MKSLNNILIGTALLIAVGCSTTVTPDQVQSNGASFDGGQRNSGFQGWTTNNNIPFAMLSTNAYQRYNALIDIYGDKFLPPVKKDHGIISNQTNYLITLEGLSDFGTMNRWHHNDYPKK